MTSLTSLEELSNDFESVSKLLADEGYRTAQWQNHVEASQKELEQIVQKTLNRNNQSSLNKDDIAIMTSSFKVLRNACVQNRPAQLYFGNDVRLRLLNNVLEIVCEPSLRKVDGTQGCLKMIAQFLGNAVVNNDESQRRFWNALFPSNVFLMMSAMEVSTKDCLFMFIYNCIKQTDEFRTDNDVSLMKGILMFCDENKDAEWGLFLVEYYISKHFVWCLKNLCDDPSLRLSLLDVLADLLDADSNETFSFQNDPLPWLCDYFETHSKCAITLQSQDKEAVAMENQLVLKLLNLMCIMSVDDKRFSSLKKSATLFEFIVYLLTSLPSNQNADKQVSPSNSANEFKQNLVILIANLSHLNSTNQNTVRRLGGIEVLLNCCHINEENPYLPQWAIFAIRNICHGNIENQSYISNMNIQSDRLRSAIRSEEDSKLEYRKGELHIKPRDFN